MPIDVKDPGHELVELANKFCYLHPSVGWEAALRHVRATDEGKLLMQAYGQKRIILEDDETLYDGEKADEVIFDLAEMAMKEDKTLDLSSAVRKIFAQDPDLAKAYARR